MYMLTLTKHGRSLFHSHASELNWVSSPVWWEALLHGIIWVSSFISAIQPSGRGKRKSAEVATFFTDNLEESIYHFLFCLSYWSEFSHMAIHSCKEVWEDIIFGHMTT